MTLFEPKCDFVIIKFVTVIFFIIQLHAVSRKQLDWQRELLKTLHVSLFAEFFEALRVEWRSSTPCFASTSERIKENINLYPRVGIEPTSVALQPHIWATTGLIFIAFVITKFVTVIILKL